MNRQRFLIELSKLMSFIQDEEYRLYIVSLYNGLFEDAADERALLALLVSPTKQAVNVARIYDAGVSRQKIGIVQGFPTEIEDMIGDLRFRAAKLGPVE